MNINVNKADVEVKDGVAIFKIDSSDLEKMLGRDKVELSTLKPGQVIRSSTGVEYIVLEQYEKGTKVIRKELLPNRREFDSRNNNFAESSIKDYLNGEYYQNEIVSGFGEDNVLEHEIDLLSLDGLDDYGKCSVKVGLLTIDDYRKYRKNCLKETKDNWWWLSTPDSTPSGYGGGCVLCVSSNGDVDYIDYDYDLGVRPDLILKSDIFVSLAEE